MKSQRRPSELIFTVLIFVSTRPDGTVPVTVISAHPDDVIAHGERTHTRTHPSADRPCAIQDREREELTVVKSHGEIYSIDSCVRGYHTLESRTPSAGR